MIQPASDKKLHRVARSRSSSSDIINALSKHPTSVTDQALKTTTATPSSSSSSAFPSSSSSTTTTTSSSSTTTSSHLSTPHLPPTFDSPTTPFNLLDQPPSQLTLPPAPHPPLNDLEKKRAKQERAAKAHKIRDSLRREALKDCFEQLLDILKADAEEHLVGREGMKSFMNSFFEDGGAGGGGGGGGVGDEFDEEEETGGGGGGLTVGMEKKGKGAGTKRAPNRIKILQHTITFIESMKERTESLDSRAEELKRKLETLKSGGAPTT
ncbi:hypothetical protein HDV05_007584 [Chytridiales sp. JEL 0842]|nr:hypothetical protein HDV05_007584 [Chytridiales sp. JEL 0842]